MMGSDETITLLNTIIDTEREGMKLLRGPRTAITKSLARRQVRAVSAVFKALVGRDPTLVELGDIL